MKIFFSKILSKFTKEKYDFKNFEVFTNKIIM